MTKYVKVAVTTQYNIIRGVKPYRNTPLRLGCLPWTMHATTCRSGHDAEQTGQCHPCRRGRVAPWHRQMLRRGTGGARINSLLLLLLLLLLLRMNVIATLQSIDFKVADRYTGVQQYGNWYTGRWRVDCYIWYSEERPERAAAPPSPLLAVPKCNSPPINGQCINFTLLDVAL